MALSKSKTVVFLVFIVAFTILFGAGCKSDKTQAIPSEPEQETEEAQADAGRKPEPRVDSGLSEPDASVIPDGWEWYKSGTAEFQYPGDWVIITSPLSPVEPELETVVSFEHPEAEFPNSIDYTVSRQTLDKGIAQLREDVAVVSESTTRRFGEVDWVSVISTDQSGRRDIHYMVERDGRLHTFASGYQLGDGPINQNMPILGQLLSTFRFGG